MIGEVLRIGFALIGVLILILVVARFAQARTTTMPGLLNTLGYLSLGPRKGIAIIKAGKEIILVGVTPTDLKLLKTIPEEAFDQTELKRIRDNIDHIRGLKRALLKGGNQ